MIAAELRRILRLASLYAVGDLFIRAAGIVLLPLYAAYLNPHEFGILSVATSVAGLAAVVFALGLNSAVLRFYYELDEKERRRFYGTLRSALLLAPAALLIILEVLHGWPASRLLDQVPYEPYLRLAFWTAFVSAALLTFPLDVFRASERPGAYVAFTLGQFALGVALTIVFVVVLGRGAAGALWARLIAGLVAGVVAAWALRRYLRPQLHWPDLVHAVVYGLPLLPHFLSHWALTASDRLILGRFVPLSAVGVYSVGYQIGSVMMLFIVAGNNAIFPLFGRLDARDGTQVTTLTRVVTYYVAAMAAVGLAITLFAREIVMVVAPRYGPATGIVPWVVLGHLFIALYIAPMNTVSLTVGRTKWIPLITGTAAVTNIVLNLLLVPRFGIIAAAVNTAVSYAVLFVLVFRYVQRIQALPYEYRRIGVVLLATGAAYALGAGGRLAFPVGALPLKIAALAVFPVLLWLLGFPSDAERRALGRLGHRPG